MLTTYRFSPNIAIESISHIKNELHRLRALLPTKAHCHAGIEAEESGSYRAWIEFDSHTDAFSSEKLTSSEIGSVQQVTGEIERQIRKWKLEKSRERPVIFRRFKLFSIQQSATKSY